MAGHAIVTKAAPTTNQTQDYTKASLGTPKGYLIFGSRSVLTLNTDADDCSISMGGSDLAAVNGFSVENNAQHNVATSNADRILRKTTLLALSTAGSSTIQEECNHNATVTDGIQGDWVNTNVAAQITALILNEGISDFDIQSPSLNGTGTTVVTVGFRADFHIVFMAGLNSGSATEGKPGICFIDANGITYHGVYNHWGSGDTTPEGAERFDETNLVGEINLSGNAFNTWTFGTYTGTGFTATKVGNSDARSPIIVSFKMAAGYSYLVSSVVAPTSTGVFDIIDTLSFTPQLAMFASADQTAVGGDSGASSIAFGACDADAQFSIGCAQQDFNSVNNTDCSSHHHGDATIYQTDDNGAVISEAAFSQFKTDAVELNWSTFTNAIRLASIVIGKDPVGPVITDVNTTESWDDGDTGLVITGTGFL